MNDLESAHRARPWRVHAVAPDFRLEDVWTFDLGDHPPEDIRAFLPCFWSVVGLLAETWLAKVRLRVGRALRWDDHDLTLPIPGEVETTVSARLGDDDLRNNLAPANASSPVPTPKVKTVYVLPREALYEFSNDAIHGLLHIALTGSAASLAVYVKPRGIWSHLYMAAIWPARRWVLYPALVHKIEGAWRRTRTGNAES